MYDNEIDLFESFEIVPIELTHFSHSFDGDWFIVGTFDLPHKINDMKDELERPL